MKTASKGGETNNDEIIKNMENTINELSMELEQTKKELNNLKEELKDKNKPFLTALTVIKRNVSDLRIKKICEDYIDILGASER